VVELQKSAEEHTFFQERSLRFYGIKKSLLICFRIHSRCVTELLVEFTGHLNEFHCHIQGKYEIIFVLYESAKGFQTELALWERQLEVNKYSYFKSSADENESGEYDSGKCTVSNSIENLRNVISDFPSSKQAKY
jgi:hypothetical protein